MAELTRAQRGLLEAMAESRYDELYLRGSDLRMVRKLREAGLIEPRGYGDRDFGITDAGRDSLQPDLQHARAQETKGEPNG